MLLGLAMALPFLVTIWLLEQHASYRIQTVEAEVAEAAEDVARHQATLLVQARALLGAVAQLPEDWRTGPGCSENFRILTNGTSWLRGIAVAGRDGRILCATEESARGIDLQDRTYFRQALEGQSFAVSNLVVLRASSREPALIAAEPLFGPDGTVQAVLFAALRIDWVATLAERVRIGTHADLAAVFDSNGVMVAQLPPETAAVGQDFRDHVLVETMLDRRKGVVRMEGLAGVRRFYGFAELPGTGTIVMVARDEGAVLAPLRREAGIAYASLLAAMALAGGLAWWFGRRVLLRGIDTMVSVLRRGGSLAALPPDRWRATEVDALHQALAGHEQRRAESEARWRALGKGDALIVWRATAEGTPLEAPGWQELTGQTEEEMRAGQWIQKLHPDDRRGFLGRWSVALAAGHRLTVDCRIAVRPDGGGPEGEAAPGWRWARIEAVPVLDEASGNVREWVGTVQDVEAQHRAEQELFERKARLRSILNAVLDPVIVVDATGIMRDANPAAERTFGWPRAELIGKSAAKLMPTEFGAAHDRHVRTHAVGGQSHVLGMRRELEGQRRDGSRFPLEIAVSQWHDGKGEVWYTGIMRDVTERRRAARALAASEERFRLLAEHSGDVVALCDMDGTRRYVSPAAERVLGWRPEELLGRGAVEFIHPEDLPALQEAHEAFRAGAMESSATYRHRHPDGSWLWVDGHARRQPTSDGSSPQHYVVVLRDASARKAAEQKLTEALARMEQIAAKDELTGLANRRSFDEAAGREWRRCARENLPLSLLMLDADHFKRFNDLYGHQAGDACLRAIAAQLEAVAQRPGDLAARYGGEEFVILLAHTEPDGAWFVAERLRALVQGLGIPHADNPGAGVVTLSIGLATAWPAATECRVKGFQALLSAADGALYQAKHDGRNRVVAATDSLAGETEPPEHARALGRIIP